MIYKRLRLTLIVSLFAFETLFGQGAHASAEMDEASSINYKLVKDPSKSPWSMIGQITTVFEDGKTVHGSCTLINEDCVLTAASNISPKHMGPQTSLPIRTNVFFTNPDGSTFNVTAKSAALHSEWDDAKSYEEVKFLDLAVLKLNKPIGAERGYVELATKFNRARNVGKTITFAGYPKNTHGTKDGKMHKSSGQVRKVEGPRLFYNNLTVLGMGGAALLVDDGVNPPKCVGVHTFGGFAPDSLNGGIAITTNYLNMINDWVAELHEISALRAEEQKIKEQLAQLDAEINELDKIASEHGYNLRKRN